MKSKDKKKLQRRLAALELNRKNLDGLKRELYHVERRQKKINSDHPEWLELDTRRVHLVDKIENLKIIITNTQVKV